jgi:hypothetical protein
MMYSISVLFENWPTNAAGQRPRWNSEIEKFCVSHIFVRPISIVWKKLSADLKINNAKVCKMAAHLCQHGLGMVTRGDRIP